MRSFSCAPATGRLLNWHVRVGETVAPGDDIGEISQDELKDAIHQANAERRGLSREDRELTTLEEHEQQTQVAAVSKLKQAVAAAAESSTDKLRIAQRLDGSANRLRALNHVGDDELLQSRNKLYDIRDDLNKGQSRLAEIELDAVKSENARRRARIERGLRIAQAQTRLDVEREKLIRTSRIISHVHGRIAQMLVSRDELVREGSPVALVHSPRSEGVVDDPGLPYESVVFVPAGEGKKVEVGHRVEVSPATVRREEHGFIRGRVIAVSQLPATKLAMEAALAHPELVDSFLKHHAPGVLLRVHIKLEDLPPLGAANRRDTFPAWRNSFQWSSASGAAQPLKTGTMCQAAIVVSQRRLINLIVPWTKRLVGAD